MALHDLQLQKLFKKNKKQGLHEGQQIYMRKINIWGFLYLPFFLKEVQVYQGDVMTTEKQMERKLGL